MTSPPGGIAQPLIRVHRWRALIALGIVLSCGLAALLGTIWLLVLLVPIGLAVAAGTLWAVSGALTAWAVESGRWHSGPLGFLQRLATVVLFAGGAALVVGGIVRGIGLLLESPDYGTPPSAAAPSLGVAAIGALTLAMLAASAPLVDFKTNGSRAAVRRATAGAGVLGAAAAIGALVAASAPAGCETFDFDRQRWQSELGGNGSARLIRMGEAVKRCGVIEPGMTSAQVRATLGPFPSRIAGTYVWWLGHRGLVSEQVYLAVRFERSSHGTPRVADVALRTD